MEDERQRDFLTGNSLNSTARSKYIDYSVKEAYTEDWKAKVRTRIRRAHGVIVLASDSSLKSAGQKWEITCAAEEKTPIYSIWAYKDDRTVIPGATTHPWTWDGITKFIDGL